MMLFILYDAQTETAFYLDLQSYFNEKGMKFIKNRKFIRVHIPTTHVFQPQMMQQIRQLKNK